MAEKWQTLNPIGSAHDFGLNEFKKIMNWNSYAVSNFQNTFTFLLWHLEFQENNKFKKKWVDFKQTWCNNQSVLENYVNV